MNTLVIAFTTPEGRHREPRGSYLMHRVGDVGSDPAWARKFSTGGDAAMAAVALGLRPDDHAILSVVAGYLEQAEAQAQAEWEAMRS